MMRRIWRGLKFLGRWLGPGLILLSLSLVFFPITPFGDAASMPALAGAIVCAIAWLFARRPELRAHRTILASCAAVGLAYWGWSAWDEGRGYRQQTVSFDNQGARLVGTLYLPDRRDRVPGLVFLPGSGAVPRHYYRSYAAHFAKAGYAVLLYDKRGIGDSSGKVTTRSFLDTDADNDFELLASDASAALSFLIARKEVRSDAAGIGGVSEGGWIAPRAAEINGHAAFLLNITSPTPTLYQVVEWQITSQNLGARELAAAKRRFKADFDPLPSLRALTIPGLWVLAASDTMVPNQATMRDLDAMRKLGKAYDYRVIPGAWHGLVIAPKKPVLDTIDTWLAQVTAQKR
jgi:dienelactone hydrolase